MLEILWIAREDSSGPQEIEAISHLSILFHVPRRKVYQNHLLRTGPVIEFITSFSSNTQIFSLTSVTVKEMNIGLRVSAVNSEGYIW